MKMNFVDCVKDYKKKEDNFGYEVVFNVHAAIYWIDAKKGKELDLLKQAKEKNLNLKIIYDGNTREILDVS